jgi:hypothetical protein
MNGFNAVRAGRIEDKWIEFVADEYAERARRARRDRRQRAAQRVACVEVHAGYVWLLAAAIATWLIR